MARSTRWTMTGFLLVGLISHSDILMAQAPGWRFTATASQHWFSSVVADTASASSETYDMEPAASVGVLADKGIWRLRVGLGVSYLTTRLRVTSPLVSIADQAFQFTRWQVAALVTVPILEVGTGGAGLALSAGPALSLWTPTGGDSRNRVSGVATLLFHAPIAPRWNLLASGGGAVSGSPMNTSEIPAEFVATTLWAWQAGLGLQYGR